MVDICVDVYIIKNVGLGPAEITKGGWGGMLAKIFFDISC